ncbi:MAG: sigma-70 family RNA polymerase sigma factor [Ruminococcus sp.]|uniref:RNA polymerase sigma factor n=1 Tax=Ruminococcus sp. TaxID=41978 RepID=UPI0025FA1B57|nr:sigma-70 family RNA polymerase sigma factor [Ruminococcus sp.]MCR5600085.1 sigma-70 family RNA polymerase sigma factor [Ruminococcus sp.]
MIDYSADVQLAREGSTDAFARLYSTVYEDLYHIALYSLRNSHDAADAVSDTVMDAFCSIKKLRKPEKFRSWIMTILAAKIKRKQRSYFEPNDELSDDSPLSENFSFESVELREAVDRLDSESRLLLSMSVLGGYSSDEISALCGIKSSTVRSKLTRIKQRLRLELTPEL